MPRQRIGFVIALALLCLAGLLLVDLREPSAYVRVCNLFRDAITRAGRRTPPNPDLIFLAIDSDSVGLEQGADIEELYGLTDAASQEGKALRLMSHRWPWSRELYGLVLERLVQAGAKVVLFDLTFPTPSEDDPPFRSALDRYPTRVVIGSNFTSAASRGYTTIGASHTRPPDSLVRQAVPMDDRVAYTNFWPDEDDVVRRAQYRLTFAQVEGEIPEQGAEQFLSLAARGMAKAGYADRIPKGLDDRVFPVHRSGPRRFRAPFDL